MSLDQPDLFGGRKRRDRGTRVTMDANLEWRARYLKKVLALPRDWTGIPEDLRIVMGDDKPRHSNCWGAAWLWFYRTLKLFEKTGDYRNMRIKRSNGRTTPVYRFTLREELP